MRARAKRAREMTVSERGCIHVGCTTGIPPGITAHTCTHTCHRSTPAAAGTGLHAGIDLRTRRYTHGRCPRRYVLIATVTAHIQM